MAKSGVKFKDTMAAYDRLRGIVVLRLSCADELFAPGGIVAVHPQDYEIYLVHFCCLAIKFYSGSCPFPFFSIFG